MRSCPACGAANGETDDFCGNCGSYLGWSRQSGAPGPGATGSGSIAEAAATAANSPATGTGTAASAGNGVTEPGREPESAQAQGTSPQAAPGAAAPSAGPSASGPATAPPHAASAAPTSPAAPPAPATPVQPAPSVASQSAAADPAPITAVQPAKPVAGRPVVRPAEVHQTDGPPCPVCGTPNQPGRRFCRRCAAPLQAAEPVAPLPWWRTRWPFRRRVRSGSGRLFRTLVTLAVLAALAVGVLFLLPAGRSLFEDTRDKLGKATAVSPSRVTASAEIPGHPAGNATDGLSNKYWGAPSVGDSLTFTFQAPFRLVDLVVTSGASTDPPVYRSEARPITVDLVTTTSKGLVAHKAITLTDKPGPQTIPTGISDVVTVQLVVRSAAGTGQGRHIALGEIEFFKRS
ncbi:zinc ribbon domain-containing protein [Streptomyces sp. CBMA152]|uniref:zinc ribbon domain-containing protein n=1 Tax=Streptomyces sp. CBMA152 TaxID=1896312 RepID=UPI0016608A24|nr:zinc ribbon domain-containing protein [Streptomyces sp. CBMA152]MBD0742327.1 hypothetical protein [Streptomyces sp. CBMA152]